MRKNVIKQPKINVYCDMDGVIADFNSEPNAVERFQTEKGFFRNLKVMNKSAFESLLNRKNINLFVLSASPNKEADGDKMAWLKQHFPKLKKSHIIFCRNGQNKADFMKTKKGILLDDYGKNCRQWRERGNVAIKITKTLAEHFNEFMLIEGLDY
jgi:5'(3')-deoxyribonucleotidase